ncbi:MAG: TonB-dependent receptor [Gemmatimonadota bacterium]
MDSHATMPRGRFRRVAWLLAAAAVAFPGSGLAQEAATGAVSGTITDENGAALAFVQVTAEGTRLGTLSDASGAYRLTGVPEGTGTIRAALIGYRSATASVSIRAGETASQSFTLAVDPLGMETVVVTATRTPTSKLESSTAITTMSSREIEEAEPRSTADLLKSVPGFYVESSGGEVNNNLFVRGLPADGSYRYVVMLEDGIPAFDANDLFFLGADNLIRFDENVERMEAVRGGNSALFGSNAPGGLVNLIDKTGGPELRGSMKASVGTEGLTRYDANVNGPLAEDWRFSIGGYYRYDDGIRDPGFPAARGGQIKANLTRLFDRGFVRVYAKYVNDKNVFYLPIPVRAKTTGDQSPQGANVVELTSEFPSGFPEDGTLTTNDANFSRIPLPQGNGEFSLPLEDGIAQVGGTFQADVNLALENGWSIENTLRAMNLSHENNAMPPGQAVTAAEFAQSFLDSSPPGATADFTFVDDGTSLGSSSGLVQNALIWHVERPISNFSNQFLLKKTATAGKTTHNITLGSYFGFYTADNLWMFNNVLTEVANAPRLLNLSIRDAGGSVIEQVTENGFTNYLGLYVNATGDATLFSFFAGDEIQVTDRLRLDVGARFERDEYDQNVENTQPFDLGGPSDADDAVNWGNRSFSRRKVDFNEWAGSIGFNYLVNDEVSVYARGSRGYKMPLLDQYIFGFFPDTAETLYQAEGGVKVSTPTFGLSALAYWVQLEDFPSQDARIDPVTGQPTFVTAIVGKARTIGAEIEGVVTPYPGVRLNGQVTLQDHEYLDFIEGGTVLDGNWIRRIPKVLLNLGASYTGEGFSIGGDWKFVGKRFSNNANTVQLPEYGYLNARASYTIPGEGLTLSVAALNLADGKGLTEGDPRFDESGVPTGFGNGRPILPQRFVFAVRYDF